VDYLEFLDRSKGGNGKKEISLKPNPLRIFACSTLLEIKNAGKISTGEGLGKVQSRIGEGGGIWKTDQKKMNYVGLGGGGVGLPNYSSAKCA